jgi:hypothetical protein
MILQFFNERLYAITRKKTKMVIIDVIKYNHYESHKIPPSLSFGGNATTIYDMSLLMGNIMFTHEGVTKPPYGVR